MLGGFALIAYPARYRASGIMSFIVNQDGVVYEKDLGKNSVDCRRDDNFQSRLKLERASLEVQPEKMGPE